MYLQVEGKTIHPEDILLPGIAVQVLLPGGIYRGSMGIERGLSEEDGLVIQPYTRNGETLNAEFIKAGLGKELKTYPFVWATCKRLSSID